MKICHLLTRRALLLIILLAGYFNAVLCADDPEQLLEWYLETGAFEYAEKIRDGFPGSSYDKFCDAWGYLGANNELAMELAGELVKDHPDFAPGHFAMGTVLTIGYNKYNEAVSHFDKSLEINPDFWRSYLNRGIAKIGLEDFNGARDDFDRVLKMKRGFAKGFLLRGVSNHGLGDEEGMKADFEIGLQLDYRAFSTIPGDLADNAINKAIESAPENAIYYFARGYASFVKGNYRAASSDFTRCIQLVPGSSDFYKYSGASKMHLDNYEGAQKDLNYALSVNPDDPETYYYLAVLMNDFLRQPAMAREYMNLAIELDEYNALYFYERSKAAHKMMNHDEALDDINRALQLDHSKGDFYALSGTIKRKIGNPAEDFCPDFRKAIEWGTSYNLKRIMKKTCK